MRAPLASVIAAAGMLAPISSPASSFESLGDTVQIALPLAAAYCAMRDDRFTSFFADYGKTTILVHGSKTGLGDTPINRRPSGGDRGFPSGHTASAFAGAAELSRHCAAGSRAARGVFYGAALLVGLSRIDANAHNTGQVTAGALVGMTAGSMRFGISRDRLEVRIGIEF